MKSVSQPSPSGRLVTAGNQGTGEWARSHDIGHLVSDWDSSRMYFLMKKKIRLLNRPSIIRGRLSLTDVSYDSVPRSLPLLQTPERTSAAPLRLFLPRNSFFFTELGLVCQEGIHESRLAAISNVLMLELVCRLFIALA